MKLFLHLKDFNNLNQNHHIQLLKILKEDKTVAISPIAVVSTNTLPTTDELIRVISQKLDVREEEITIKLVIKHQDEYKRIRVVKGFSLSIYSRVPADKPSSLQYQMQLEVDRLGSSESKTGQTDLKDKPEVVKSENPETFQESNQQIYRHSKQLFQFLKNDELGEFINLVDLFSIKYSALQLKILLNLFDEETGFTLLHLSITFNKYQFLQTLIKDYSEHVDFNLKSVDGWLPAQLAILVENTKSMDFFIEYHEDINMDLNCSTEHGQTIFLLIDTINLDLIQEVVKKFPIRFEDIHKEHQVNVYEYVWNHHRLAEGERKELINLMHEKHIENYDSYRWDQILYTTCKKYLPEATKKISPKKQNLSNLTFKIISGEIIKCKSSALLSRYIFLSVNSYIGAIQQYQINRKIKLANDKEKLDKYNKELHLSFEQIQSVYLMDHKDKSWLLKKEWHCFVIKEKRDKKYIFACNHEHTANQWIEQIKQAMKAWGKIRTKSFASNSPNNYVHISDLEYKSSDAGSDGSKGKLSANKLIQFFSSRLSLCESQSPTNDSSIGRDLQSMKSKSTYNKLSGQIASEPLESKSLRYKDFKFIQLLGQGSFGQVFLVSCLKNNRLYALKVFQKKKIILSKQTKFVIAEVNILKQIRHPFINSLYFTFQTPNFIYLGLEYCQGKDLSKHLNQEMTFDEADVKIYAAQIVLAIEYLHSMGIIYRDLKPENIMLGKDGHILLVDFGLSKKTQNNFAKTFCGSPAYLSPEMLDRNGVGPQSDYFTLGVVIYEFIFGEPPFYADNIHLLYENIQNGRIKFPRKIDDVTRDFLTKLLEKEPKQRLGSRSIEDIKNHGYFQGLDWLKLYKKQIEAPHRDLLDEISDEIQDQIQLIKIFHDDFDYSEENFKINRFKNFSFVREEEFK